jgi:hypothetical protein
MDFVNKDHRQKLDGILERLQNVTAEQVTDIVSKQRENEAWIDEMIADIKVEYKRYVYACVHVSAEFLGRTNVCFFFDLSV